MIKNLLFIFLSLTFNRVFVNASLGSEKEIIHVYSDGINYTAKKTLSYNKRGENSFITAHSSPKKPWRQSVLIYTSDPEAFEQEKLLIKSLDRRTRITETTSEFYRIIAQLTLTFGAQEYGGSGVLVGPHHVLTCGHNVYDYKKKKWANNITIHPALNEDCSPFGEAKAIRVYTFNQWVENGDSKFDMALLILDHSIGKYTGWGSLLCLEDEELSRQNVNITGYPGDKKFKQMWGMSNTMTRIKDEEFDYEIDTFAGQSGSAILIHQWGLVPLIIGVHATGSNHINSGVRLSKNKFKSVHQWIADTYKIDKKKVIMDNPINLSYVGNVDGKVYLSSSANTIEWTEAQQQSSNWNIGYHLLNLQSFNKKFYAAYGNLEISPHKGNIFLSYCENKKDWIAPYQPASNWRTEYPITLHSFNNRLYLAHIGVSPKGSIYLSSSEDGRNWLPPYQPAANWRTEYPITLQSFNNRLYLAHIGASPKGTIYLSSSEDGRHWTAAEQPNSTWRTEHPVSLQPFNNRFYLGYVERKPKGVICLASSEDGKYWSDIYQPNTTWRTDYPISLSSHMERVEKILIEPPSFLRNILLPKPAKL